MNTLIFFLLLPLSLFAFEPQIVTPTPVVGFRQLPFYDETNQTERNVLVWYPVDPLEAGKESDSPWDLFKIALNAAPAPSQNKYPVVVISHGYTGNPHQLSWLTRWLVHNGFIVLGIQHLDLIRGQSHLNHWKRAVDVRKMIDLFSRSPVAESANLNKIAIAGYSLGGTTALWIAGGKTTKLDKIAPGPDYASPQDFILVDLLLPFLDRENMAKDWRDPRVKAAFAMAPAWAWLFDEYNLQKISIPVYLIAADEDKVLVTRNNAGFFSKHIPGAFFKAISGKAGHYIFISFLNSEQRKKADPNQSLNFLFEEDASIDRAWIQQQVSNEAVRFFKENLD